MNVDWNWIKQRPHFLAEQLAHYYDITVVNQYRYTKKGYQSRKFDGNFVSFKVVPRIDRYASFRWINVILKKKVLKNLIDSEKPDFIWLTDPDQINWLPKELGNDKFCRSFRHDDFIIKYCANGSLHAPFAKVCNPKIQVNCERLGDSDNSQLWVDIFPVDGVPHNERERNRYFKKNLWMMKKLMFRRSPYVNSHNFIKNFLKRIVFSFYNVLPADYDVKLSKKMEKLARSQPLECSEFFALSWEERVYPIKLNDKRVLYE